jgi:drug/metabolite transporter (DMT)-like permease
MTIRSRAILDITFAASLWGVPSLFIHYFRLYLDADTQNFWRYFSALVFLVLYGWYSGARMIYRDVRVLARVVLTAAVLVGYQTCYSLSLYHAKPALVSLLIQMELIVAVGLSCVFFGDERRVARSPWFIAGACAALAGAVGMVLFSHEFATGGAGGVAWKDFVIAIALVGGAAVLWGSYSVGIKICLQVMPPFSAFFHVETLATVAFLLIGLARGELGEIARAPVSVTLMVFFTGVGCIAVAHVFYTRAIQRLGVSVCNTVILTCPIVTAVASWVVFGEHLRALQIVSAVVLLGGAAAAIRANEGGRQAAPVNDVTKKPGQSDIPLH